jgi:hypothetical protein
MKNLLYLTIVLLSFISCNNNETTKPTNQYFINKEFSFSKTIDSIMDYRVSKMISDNNLNGLAISFNNTIDSTRFIIHGVYSINFLKRYPPTYFFKVKEKYVFVYSGLEPYLYKDIELTLPNELYRKFIDLDKTEPTVLVHPEYIEYSYFNLDSTNISIVEHRLDYNRFLLLK